jgi:transposase
LRGVLIKDYQFHKEIGVIIHIEGEQQQASCPRSGLKSDRLHQNHWHLVKDLPTAARVVYLRVNCRQFKSEKCQKPFSESLDNVGKNRNYTKRLARRIIEEVLDSNIRSVARRNGLSEEEVQTMLKDVAQ